MNSKDWAVLTLSLFRVVAMCSAASSTVQAIYSAIYLWKSDLLLEIRLSSMFFIFADNVVSAVIGWCVVVYLTRSPGWVSRDSTDPSENDVRRAGIELFAAAIFATGAWHLARSGSLAMKIFAYDYMRRGKPEFSDVPNLILKLLENRELVQSSILFALSCVAIVAARPLARRLLPPIPNEHEPSDIAI